MTPRRYLLIALALVATACASTPPVAVERADRSVGPLEADRTNGLPDVGADLPPTPVDLPVVATPDSTLVWGGCEDFAIPTPEQLGTARWECARLTAPMDPFGDVADAGDVELALTRHRATGERRGTIVVNPGGPGGEGLPAAWGVRMAMSASIVRSFDIVAWDPRGIGQSTPKIDCDDDIAPGSQAYIAACVDATGPLSAFLSAPYSAADLDAVRSALGEERLNFLGYSYGTIIGATYAASYPDRVGSFVLDGATDPLAGSADGPFSDGFPTLADDGTQAARDRFAEICNATDRCLFSLDAATVLEDLSVQVAVLPTAFFDGEPEQFDTEGFESLIDTSMTYAGDWELLATGLSDADRGDASALAALAAGVAEFDAPTGDDDDDSDDGDGGGASSFVDANFMIYCADLGPQIVEWTFCDDMPVPQRPLMPVQRVDVDRDILVIGTEYDPLTPGYHAAEFAAALGDATHLIWEGVGHTAYPGWTPCVDDAVDAQFLQRGLPPDATRCSFLLGVDDDRTLGDELFGQGDLESRERLEDVLFRREAPGDPVCLADELNQATDQQISHVILDVTSPEAIDAIAAAEAAC